MLGVCLTGVSEQVALYAPAEFGILAERRG